MIIIWRSVEGRRRYSAGPEEDEDGSKQRDSDGQEDAQAKITHIHLRYHW